MEKIRILNIDFTNASLKEAVDFTINNIKLREKSYAVTPNAEMSYLCFKNDEFANIVNQASLVLPDGSGVVLASKIIGKPLKQKVAGVEFAEELVLNMARENMSLFILGAGDGVAKKALENLSNKYSGLKIAGYNDGFFENDDEVISKINETQADVLFVCLGCPKQEQFIYNHFEKLDVGFMCGLGGSADVFSGNAKRAPKIFIKLKLEWFYRLICQPSRLKRMLNIPKYLFEVIKRR